MVGYKTLVNASKHIESSEDVFAFYQYIHDSGDSGQLDCTDSELSEIMDIAASLAKSLENVTCINRWNYSE